MRNPHGSFIWYELLTSDADAAGAFYSQVVGWTASDSGQPGMDYRLFSAAGTDVAGHMTIPADAATAGMRPIWLGYVAVDDVDRCLERIGAAGGSTRMPPMDLEGVGRIAMAADPQGIPFYIMRGAMDVPSVSHAQEVGHCAWNELSTSDPEGALAFYTDLFGWEPGDAMPMGEMGEYRLLELGGEMFGAVMRNPPGGPPPMWRFYFQVADIDAAGSQVRLGGGTVHHGPVEVPGGDYIVVASDPQGAQFGLVGPRKGQ